MAYLNEHYLKLQAGYLFPEVARLVREFCEAHPEGAKRLIRCGIGDVTEPLPPAAIEAMKRAIDELGHRESFRGYGPEQGYEFLRSTIAQRDYRDRNIQIADDEIFVSDGSKTIAVTSRHSRRPKQGRGPRSGVSGVRGHQRDGGPHGPGAKG